ncbi:MAG: M15 family metallopeptidase [Rikenellaceae bacterium]|nr:M15 family metallopeptidase [Rikenellaceae bacterium]
MILLLALSLGFSACNFIGRQAAVTRGDTLPTGHAAATGTGPSTDSPTAARLRAMGMVDIAEIEPSIAVHIVYATPDNFMGYVLYDDLDRAFMLPETARRLVGAQRALEAARPGCRLIVYDAARPLSIQQRMWDRVKGTDKAIFVSNPANGGGLHNYGAAVDVTILDSAGRPLPMGSAYDFFGDEARIADEEGLFRAGRITREELDNRRLLRRVMTGAGFRTIASEWWHFNLVSRDEAVRTLRLIE